MPETPAEQLPDTQHPERGTPTSAARFQAAFAHVGVGLSLTDLQGRFLEVNPAFCALMGYSAAEMLAADFAALTHPDDRPGNLALVARLRAGDIPQFDIEKRYVRKDGAVVWVRSSVSLARDGEGRPFGMVALTEDITEKAERGRRERFLADLAERASRLPDPDGVIADAVRSLGEFLGVSRCVFADIDIEADTCTISLDYCADATVASIAGTFPISSFGAFVTAEYAAGRVAVVDDVRADPVKAPPDTVAAYEAIGVRAYVAAPVLHSARLVSAIAVHSGTPRRWQPEEVQFIRAVVERTWLTVEVLRQQRALAREAEALREAHERTGGILESITDAFFALDREWRFTYLNDQGERLLRRTREELLGKCVWEEFPDAVGSSFDRQYRRAVDEGVTVSFEEFYPPLGGWFEVRAYPSSDGLAVYFHDIGARRQAEEGLRRSREDLRLAIDAARLGTFFCDWPFDKITWNQTCKRHFFLPADVDVDFALFYALLHPDDRAPTRAAIDLAMADRTEYNVEYRTQSPDGRTRWVNAVGRGYYNDAGDPVRFDGITIDISERKALEAQRERLADANRLLLESTGEGIYGIDAQGRFTFVNGAAARMLGHTPEEMIGRNGHALIHHSRHDGTPYPERDCPIHRALRMEEGVRVEDDVFWCRDGTPFPVSFSAAPISEGGAVTGAVVTFSDIGARKAMEAERAQIAEREHRIAEQLQAALQPDLPGAVPGLAVSRHYEAALTDQAGVGGDFYDVFSIEKGRTALVLGDLSGKGLQAAAAVATVRNMLRAFLYTKPTVAEAATELNRVLAENNLLKGFTTLFVSAYDGVTRVLNFVNCGQEPALVRRAATGEVEPLPPTGPILGALENAQYTEGTVTLAPGDALAVFSDGITECGPRRTDMLGIEGVTALFRQPVAAGEAQDAAELAERLMLRLVAGVDAAAAGGVMRDDVCLLVAVVT